jgi:hypothetical protein
MKIIKIIESPKLFKRYRVIMDDGKHYDFGLDTGSTYIDHHNDLLRKNYRLRHLGNKQEEYYIDNLIPSPALFSYYLLWGNSTSLRVNIDKLNAILENKYK